MTGICGYIIREKEQEHPSDEHKTENPGYTGFAAYAQQEDDQEGSKASVGELSDLFVDNIIVHLPALHKVLSAQATSTTVKLRILDVLHRIVILGDMKLDLEIDKSNILSDVLVDQVLHSVNLR